MLQVVFGDVYMLDDKMKWKTLPPMPKPDSHIEFAWAIVSNSIVIVGGTTEKHPVMKKMVLGGEIFQFNFDTLVLSSYLLYSCVKKIFVYIYIYAYVCLYSHSLDDLHSVLLSIHTIA